MIFGRHDAIFLSWNGINTILEYCILDKPYHELHCIIHVKWGIIIELNQSKKRDVFDDEPDDFDEWTRWLRRLTFGELLAVHYRQVCEINRIRDLILNAGTHDDDHDTDQHDDE